MAQYNTINLKRSRLYTCKKLTTFTSDSTALINFTFAAQFYEQSLRIIDRELVYTYEKSLRKIASITSTFNNLVLQQHNPVLKHNP